MANMTKKEFLLIEDAVIEGSNKAIEAISVLSRPSLHLIESIIRTKFSQALSQRLRYVSDNFDPALFCTNISMSSRVSGNIVPKWEQEDD